MCDRVLFSLNKEFFRYCKKQLHFGVKIVFFFLCVCFFFFFSFFFLFFFFFFFLEMPIFLRIFWPGVVGAIDTFVAEHVANMLR